MGLVSVAGLYYRLCSRDLCCHPRETGEVRAKAYRGKVRIHVEGIGKRPKSMRPHCAQLLRND